MFRNYLTVALRNLQKHKIFSFINVFGLSVGIACCMLLALYIKDEFSYEKHFESHEDIYRVTSTFIKEDGVEEKMPRTSPPVALTMLEEFPELESATRVVNPPEVEQHLLRYEDKTFFEKKGYLVDSTFFDVFSYEFAEGDRTTALDDRSTVVLSSRVANKIFGHDSAIDKQVIINSGSSVDTFRVTGVLKPYSKNSQIDADFYMAMNSEGWGDYIVRENNWVGNNFIYTYIKVRPETNVNSLTAKFPALLEKHGGTQMKEMGLKKTMSVQPLKDVHLFSARDFTSSSFGFLDIGDSGNILYIYILGSICIFILLIACINFMNLTTAKASQRAGEVGVRKSLGANRSNLIGQFLGESMTIVLISMIMSIGLVQMVLPFFNVLTQKDLSLNSSNIGYIIVALVGISLITGLIAGSYPAFFLSSFQPAKVLKDKRLSGGSSNWLRKGLVVFQFVIAITLISSIIIIHKQLRYIQDKSLGFNPEYRILLPLRTNEAQSNYPTLKTRFEQLSGIKLVSASTAVPSMPTMRDLPLYKEGSSMENAISHFNINIDENYFDLLDIKLIAGRNLVFEKDSFNFYRDFNHILINRASADRNGMTPEEAVGSKLRIDWQGRRVTFQIEGVVENFHQMSMHREVPPMIFILPVEKTNYVSLCVAVDAKDYANTFTNMKKAWKEVNPNTPFESTFLSDNIKQQYASDERNLSIITTFTIIAILISCLGLYGLSIYVAERRIKEIGIRKVLGASVTGIVGMLSKDFIKLVGLAFLISIPAGYYAMDQWLQNFAYKTELNVSVFILAGLVSFSIAWITVGFESIKAAIGNPVDSLRNE
jgi:putative ABC transport system permease protein